MKTIRNIIFFALFVAVYAQFNTVTVHAEYQKTFRISAYYSPLPCQTRYVTGSYEGDIRLNGRGTNGADGTEVYPGMIAAPKTYAFGTKINIPGIGMTTVHDRGGAIVDSGSYSGEYDRLDIWMGYGDLGLIRALNWGKRNITATVFGVDSSIADDVYLIGYTPHEAVINTCSAGDFLVSNPAPLQNTVEQAGAPVAPVVTQAVNANYFVQGLGLGDAGSEVRKLQEELAIMNFYKSDYSGNFDTLTEHALYKFQQSQGIIMDESSPGAGYFGPKTRNKMNEILAIRDQNLKLIAEANQSSMYIANEMAFGDRSLQVAKLQEFLISQDLYEGSFTSNYYGEITRLSVLNFQLEHGIVTSESDLGAGRVGPATLAKINSLS